MYGVLGSTQITDSQRPKELENKLYKLTSKYPGSGGRMVQTIGKRMISDILFAQENTGNSSNDTVEKILEWRKKYNTDNATQWQRIRFDTPHLKEPAIFDMNILPKDKFLPYMKQHLQFIGANVDDADRFKFSRLEYEKFRRVVDYMANTNYEPEQLEQARRNFSRWFTEYDKRSGSNIVETFPELEEFYNEYR